MENLKTFESFNDPNKLKTVDKVQISSYIIKSDFFALKNKKEKDFIKKSSGKEFDKFKKDDSGNNYIITTGDPDVKEIEIPKKYIYEVLKK